MNFTWSEWASELLVDVQLLLPRQFIVLDCLVGLSANPYVQVARESDATWYCEVASRANFAAEGWLADDLVLVAAGWEPPEAPESNWFRSSTDCAAIVDLLVGAIRFARGCPDPFVIVGSQGQWPPPRTDHVGEPSPRPRPFGLAA